MSKLIVKALVTVDARPYIIVALNGDVMDFRGLAPTWISQYDQYAIVADDDKVRAQIVEGDLVLLGEIDGE